MDLENVVFREGRKAEYREKKPKGKTRIDNYLNPTRAPALIRTRATLFESSTLILLRHPCPSKM